ncbi:MAG: hypothetical protein R6U15_06575 [Candidatus Izemoplasmatales bacterium]
MKQKNIDWDKPLATKEGNRVTLLTKERNHPDFPIVVLIHYDDIPDSIEDYTVTGTWHIDKESLIDLINIPEKKEGWTNFYKYKNNVFTGDIFESKEKAIEVYNDTKVYFPRDYKKLGVFKVEWKE